MFDLMALAAAVKAHGTVARVVIAAHDGSCPRETGAAMLVWGNARSGGQFGTIGGGALEHMATQKAREMIQSSQMQRSIHGDRNHSGQTHGAVTQGDLSLTTKTEGATKGALPQNARLDRIPLGPALGQCCGGAVSLVTEVYDGSNLPQPPVVARSIDGSAMPLDVRRLLAGARNQGARLQTQFRHGWLIEPVCQPTRHLWLWGAGHVGRAIAEVMAPLPDLSVTWVDIAPDRFPVSLPPGVRALPAPDPAEAVALAPQDAEHLILTFSHVLDLELCHRLLNHGFSRCGLVGSATKWARFRTRLTALGHNHIDIARIDCPIGDPSLGKHPQAIALGVATAFLRAEHSVEMRQKL